MSRGPISPPAPSAGCRARDPRIDPQPGDVLDDDPPLTPLTVTERRGAMVTGLRSDPPRRPGTWRGTLEQWHKEMADAAVVRRSR